MSPAPRIDASRIPGKQHDDGGDQNVILAGAHRSVRQPFDYDSTMAKTNMEIARRQRPADRRTASICDRYRPEYSPRTRPHKTSPWASNDPQQHKHRVTEAIRHERAERETVDERWRNWFMCWAREIRSSSSCHSERSFAKAKRSRRTSRCH